MGQLDDRIIANKLLWGDERPDKEFYEIIMAASLFTVFRIEGQEKEYKYIANLISEKDHTQFYRAIQHFCQRGVIERRGGLCFVSPPPLAVRLAAEWFELTPPDKIEDIITKLPPSLIEPFCERLEHLHFSPLARETAKKLCKRDSFFGRAETLISERGSRVFRAICTIAPEEAVESLFYVFKDMPIDYIKAINGNTRRNLVSAIEDLCFWEETFLTAGKILILFAVGENENWANNATGNLMQLFKLGLSGTRANLMQRLELHDLLMEKDNDVYNLLAITAIESAINMHQTTKMITAEQQGGRLTMEDYYPKDWSEIKEYFTQMFSRLCRYAVRRNAIGEQARQVITDNIWSWIQMNYYPWICQELDDLGKQLNYQWDEMYKTLKKQNSFIWENLDESKKEIIEYMRKKYEPVNFAEKIRLMVSNAPQWIHVKNEKGEYEDLSFKEALRFGEECGANTSMLKEVYHILPSLVEQTQKHAYAFGQGLAKQNADHRKFLDLYFKTLIKADKPDSSLLAGYLNIIRDTHRALINEILDKIACEERLFDELVSLTCHISPNKHDLLRVLSAVGVKPLSLKRFMYGNVLGHLDEETALWFCSEIGKMGNEGKSASLEISHMILFGHNEYFYSFENLIFQLVSDPYIIGCKDETQHEKYTWQQLGKMLAKFGTIDHVSILLDTILNWIVNGNSEKVEFDDSIFPVIQKIVIRKPDEALDMIVAYYRAADDMRKYYITQVCHSDIGPKHKNIFDGIDESVIHQWIKKHGKEVIPFIFETIHPLVKEGVIDNITAYIINEYGDDIEIQKCFEENIRGRFFSFWGCLSKQYELILGAIDQFANHENVRIRRWMRDLAQRIKKIYEAEKIREEEETIRLY